MACADESVQSCARSSASQNAEVKMLNLAGNFTSAQQVYPLGIAKNLELLPVSSFEQKCLSNGTCELTVSRRLSDMLAIGLYGRSFDKDILD